MADSKNPKPLPEGYDPELEKANKGMAAYEAEQSSKQKKIEDQDKAAAEFVRNAKEKIKSVMPKFKAGGSVSSASKRADGCAIKGKTRGRML